MLGQRINAYVVSNRIPKNKLARKVGMSEAALSLSLNEKRGLAAEEYIAICDALCVPYDLFIEDGSTCEEAS